MPTALKRPCMGCAKRLADSTSVRQAAKKYEVSEGSLRRWIKEYDGQPNHDLTCPRHPSVRNPRQSPDAPHAKAPLTLVPNSEPMVPQSALDAALSAAEHISRGEFDQVRSAVLASVIDIALKSDNDQRRIAAAAEVRAWIGGYAKDEEEPPDFTEDIVEGLEELAARMDERNDQAVQDAS